VERSKPTDDAEDAEPSVSAPPPRHRNTPPTQRLPQQAVQAQGGAVPPSARKRAEAQAAELEAKKQRKQQEQLRTFPMASLQRARYTLQLRFSSDFSTLQRIHQRLRKKGYTSATLTREVFRQKRYFRLTIGAFRSPQQAQAYMRLFQQAERTKTTLHKLRKP
jgi:septal ring-binding cell division protein DamX